MRKLLPRLQGHQCDPSICFKSLPSTDIFTTNIFGRSLGISLSKTKKAHVWRTTCSLKPRSNWEELPTAIRKSAKISSMLANSLMNSDFQCTFHLYHVNMNEQKIYRILYENDRDSVLILNLMFKMRFNNFYV